MLSLAVRIAKVLVTGEQLKAKSKKRLFALRHNT